MKSFLFALLFLVANVVYAQQQTSKKQTWPDSTAYYMQDDLHMAYDKDDAKFLRLIIKADSGFYNVQDYHMNGNLRLLTMSTRDTCYLEHFLHGKYTSFDTSGIKRFVKYYNKGVQTGNKVSFYPNGKIYSIIEQKQGKELLKEFRDTAGNVVTTNGNGKWIDFYDGKNEFDEGTVKDGLKDGKWSHWQNDKVTNVTTWKRGVAIDFYDGSTLPKFRGGEMAFHSFLNNRVHFNSKEAVIYNINKGSRLSFYVETDGTLSDIKLFESHGKKLDEQIITAIKNSPKWTPGSIDGKPARMKCNLVINFIPDDSLD